MQTIHKTRLKRLAKALRTLVPEEQFSIESWIKHKNVLEPKTAYARVKDNKLSLCCADAACAVGWACVLPSLKKEGLHFDPVSGMPAYQHEIGFGAVQSFFGLSDDESYRLFSSGSQDGAVNAAKRIEKLLAKKG